MTDWALIVTAAGLGVFHTLVGPDHYLPLIVLSRLRRWTVRRTLGITLLCSLGHVLSSVVLGGVGIFLGLGVSRLEAVESRRGDLAAWLLISLGLIYLAWGLRRATQVPRRGGVHAGATRDLSLARATPWTLFLVFALGPCEPLIPVLMYPAATSGVAGVMPVCATFALATLTTMALVVLVGSAGLSRVPLEGWGRYGHPVAAATIVLCGLSAWLL